MKVLKRMRLNYKYWVGVLVLLGVVSVALIIFHPNEIVKDISVEIAGASIFILIISVAFKKIMM